MRKRSLVASGAAVLGLGLVIPAAATWKDHLSKLSHGSAGAVTDTSLRGIAVPENTEGKSHAEEVSRRDGKRWADWAALGGLGTVVASIAYVLLNSVYVEFYESLGVRPEDVGFDRLAILARALGLALVALFVVGILFVALALSPLPSQHFGSPPSGERIRWNRLRVGVAALAACLLVMFAVTLPIIASSHQAELVEKGIHVGPIRFGPLVLIDVSADAARIHWLDKDVPPPPLLSDPRLLYLGSNNRVTVFMACGTTVIIPADKVVPEVLTTKDARLRKNAEPSQEYRRTFCATH
jgi:hypothetical protein